VRPLVKSACTPIDWSGPQGSPACHAWYRWAVGQIRRLQPDVAVITGDYSEAGPSDGSASAVERTFGDLVGRLQRSAGRVVLVGNDPGVGQEPVDCLLSRQASMARCTTTWPAERFAVNDDLAALAPIQRFGFIDTAGWFCVARACPMVIGRTIAYRDTNHITRAYALELDAPFRAAFRRAAQPERSG
jgi:hypothetical protein